MSAGKKLVIGLAMIVLAGVLATSVTGLAEVAELAHMPALSTPLGAFPLGTIGLILAFDGMQVLTSVALHMRRAWGLAVLMVTMALASGAVQGFAAVARPGAPTDLPAWFIFGIHASPAVFLIGAEAVAMYVLGLVSHPVDAVPEAVTGPVPVALPETGPSLPVEPARTMPETATGTLPEGDPGTPARPARVARPKTGPKVARTATGQARTTRPARTFDQLTGDARALADRLEVAPTDLSGRQLREGLGIGSDRARELVTALARPVLHAVGAEAAQ